MAIPRQENSPETGRVNQKRRTRAAIVAAARELLGDGTTPTVPLAAKRADVSRTTAYRYFPTQESLLVEVAVNVDVDEIEALVAHPTSADEVPDRLVDVLTTLNRHVLADEPQYRTMLRLYLDMWSEAIARGETDPVVREGRRRRWIDTTMRPLRGTVPAEDLDRLNAALALTTGAEAMVALRDVAHLDRQEAIDVAQWTARTLIAATIGPPTAPEG